MGTKVNPAPFDCYANAEPDEPMFVLLARDRVGADIVRMWVVFRMLGLTDEGRDLIEERAEIEGIVGMIRTGEANTHGVVAPDEWAQLIEALDCADAMQQWRETHR